MDKKGKRKTGGQASSRKQRKLARRRAKSTKSRLPYRVSERRAFFLKQLGFRSYPAYLRSDLWASIRKRVLDRAGGKCERPNCYRNASQVHHLSYGPPTLRGDRLDKLAALCRGCHLHIEFNGWGDKVPLDKANSRLRKQRLAHTVALPQRLEPDLLGDSHLRAILREEF